MIQDNNISELHKLEPMCTLWVVHKMSKSNYETTGNIFFSMPPVTEQA